MSSTSESVKLCTIYVTIVVDFGLCKNGKKIRKQLLKEEELKGKIRKAELHSNKFPSYL